MPSRVALSYTPVSTHTSLEDALLALHALDSFDHVTAYNYGAFGTGRVYRCISHKPCPRRVRIVQTIKDEDEIPVTFELSEHGEHGTKLTNRKRVGIDVSIKPEADSLLASGMDPEKCRVALQTKYADQPEMLAKVPGAGQLRNRRLTLKKHNWQTFEPGADTAADMGETIAPAPRVTRKRKKRAESSVESSKDDGVLVIKDDTSIERHAAVIEVERNLEEGKRFGKRKLMEEFTALPGRPGFWSILKKTTIKPKRGGVVTEWITGQVVGWRTSESKPTEWVVRFTDGEKTNFKLEELVDEIRSAVQLGLNVTGKPRNF
ncbi:hypothetical protein V7S43_000689 [Phytophthora oleae]|uniref:Uncharacterized protein n=1 Tax=Phytophthora oleae TaxID=2107226 RepID=A0ABD3G806_9STRA